ncbi:hypothetical protein Taro_044061 [Colocasia esculenta]|uniref:Uncharacterized protein n=1 Tax=Colocasia esculenta TaxID=4460 RepID=A0A843WTL3_COLES|nr:hypothetical protein [Colocasia esculenta]
MRAEAAFFRSRLSNDSNHHVTFSTPVNHDSLLLMSILEVSSDLYDLEASTSRIFSVVSFEFRLLGRPDGVLDRAGRNASGGSSLLSSCP